jgi:hypothetical protein
VGPLQSYNLDRCWNAVLDCIPTLPADRTSSILVDTPWPQPVEYHEQVPIASRPRGIMLTRLLGRAVLILPASTIRSRPS